MTEEALAAFFQADAPMRISTLSSERMIVQRLIDLFGENELFNEDIAAEMKRNMIKDLEENRKEEYMSEPGKFSLNCFYWYVCIVCLFTLDEEIFNVKNYPNLSQFFKLKNINLEVLFLIQTLF